MFFQLLITITKVTNNLKIYKLKPHQAIDRNPKIPAQELKDKVVSGIGTQKEIKDHTTHQSNSYAFNNVLSKSKSLTADTLRLYKPYKITAPIWKSIFLQITIVKKLIRNRYFRY